MGALGLLALFIRANFSLICNTPRDGVFPDRVKIKITISSSLRKFGATLASRYALGRMRSVQSIGTENVPDSEPCRIKQSTPRTQRDFRKGKRFPRSG